MRARLPSLNALRAFEAAGRLGSLSAAALELGVTVGAVSRHVGLLEAHFGLALFARQRIGVRPTDAGTDYLLAVSKAFDAIDIAGRAVAARDCAAPLKLRFYTSFATEWLAPRLPGFRAAHPDIPFEITLATEETDWHDDFDLAMTAVPPVGPAFHKDLLFESYFALICAPDLVDRPNGIASAADLAHRTLLMAPRERALWPVVLGALGAAPVEAQQVMRFESLSLTCQAARGGGGIALGILFILADDLHAGRLVLPFDTILHLKLPHYIVSRRTRLSDPRLTIFRRWLIDEASACEAALERILAGRAVVEYA